jgi:Ca2+-binding EF-hand superfamily protein
MSRMLIAILAASLIVGSAWGATAADPKPKKPKKSPAERFAALDADKDQKLTTEEFVSKRKNDDQKKAGAKRFKKLDTDRDGSLTIEEFKTPPKPKKK